MCTLINLKVLSRFFIKRASYFDTPCLGTLNHLDESFGLHRPGRPMPLFTSYVSLDSITQL